MKDNIDRLAALQGAGGMAPADGALAYAEQCSLDDFYAYMPMHSYIFAPSREMWPARSVNARIPPILRSAERQAESSASAWLDREQRRSSR